MRIALIGATGRVGRHIAQEAGDRGHSVNPLRRGDVEIFDAAALARAVQGHDALVSAYGAPTDALLYLLATAAKSAIRVARLAGIARVLTIGGAGVLEASPGIRLAIPLIFRRRCGPRWWPMPPLSTRCVRRLM